MITTHVLDTTRGRPANGVRVTLYASEQGGREWRELGSGMTDDDGRLRTLTEGTAGRGWFRLSFETGAWFKDRGTTPFHPVIDITFEITESGDHVHVPLLISPYSYTTYRGS